MKSNGDAVIQMPSAVRVMRATSLLDAYEEALRGLDFEIRERVKLIVANARRGDGDALRFYANELAFFVRRRALLISLEEEGSESNE